MIVTCPTCSTHFSLPEAALGPRGRTLRCARCGHTWRVDAPPTMDETPLESAPAAARQQPFDAAMTANLFADGKTPGEMTGVHRDSSEIEGEGAGPLQPGGIEDPFAKISELMMARAPEPIPDVFSSPRLKPVPRRKGAAVLWLLLAVLLLASIGTGLYFFQDRIIDHWPPAAALYEKLGIRNDVVGAGLAFRNYNSERTVEDNNEVLIVRGVIANTTEQPHEIPLLRLALYNNATLLQEKIINPPQTTLEARATVGFRITLDQPDANATRFEVTFTAPKPPAK